MINHLKKNAVQIEWVGNAPGKEKKIAMLVPQFNESKNHNFESRLCYFKTISKSHEQEIDLIIIDDGSTDNSLEIINQYLLKNPGAFYLASIRPNASKVGALFLTALSISHEYVILSDFDTDTIGLQHMLNSISELSSDVRLMGGYFRMLPFEGTGHIFRYQQLEYTIARSLYKFHAAEKSIRVMPGAGSCFKRQVLVDIYHHHSGLRNGEDREATVLGLKLGYKTIYLNNILALTRPPLSMKALIKQRIRWNLGYLETLAKERNYYLRLIARGKKIGLVTFMDLLTIAFIVLLPVMLLTTLFLSPVYFLISILAIYISQVAWCGYLISSAPHEAHEFKSRQIEVILAYPVLKIAVDYCAWMGAIIKYFKHPKVKAVHSPFQIPAEKAKRKAEKAKAS
ncbi:Glycosyltransferase, catalytic subunit of cellulose synthase and poly-beta-1,6-N-acetylglucosamine synthase [Chitinophaga costaii]|uniref:Glycosyltransferase, catalytic subunit of cellulose synthase and poly-beta-1,6-N-acetylglucosamine synthase n=1 Tax=Chitinophaga costaii TaxID=1335309 RepID=A0A1C3YUU5_9BACT|nr:glycosyltransferase family 2 protein [Chitinophaga costaii]PUZ30114.1 hypothetical protein DCM91_01160 [Chitinophaga costaii]SCB73830.1 Glycosyltransferase, catalytic subunit of cellulose synthase and poly-beta-1,6-N-acetylglucosamine synthase [Chitinophaga costaii]